jgi:NADPH-dependent 2,4-dienoyl-CoA reductase/sulfur reductase-like enzyme/peroxiredoxin family protein/rhodanese-related sulfurtransferase/TusA-related sulfurtransferase
VEDPKRIVIVGGVAGGASAAARARRVSEDAEIILFERGDQISFANCGMPYHIGGTISDRQRLLVQTAEGMHKRYRIEVRTRSEVLRIDRAQRQVAVRNLDTGQEYVQPYDALILSPGAEPIRPPIPGVGSPGVFTLRSLADMDRIKAAIEQGRPERAVVVGGGYIGLEMTEALRQRGVGVTLVELAPQVFSAVDSEMVAPVHQQLQLHGVDLRLGRSVTQIEERAAAGLRVTLSSGETVDCSLLILAIGVRPESALARAAGLEVSATTGGIVVDAGLRTSDPHIWAVGDAVEVTHLVGGQKLILPLAGPANRQGRIAADNALGGHSLYGHSQGTAICKVFDLAVGITGLSERVLKQLGRRYEKVYVHPASHAGYYPGASQMSLKLLFDPTDGRILGGQVVGTHGVDKRIDVLAVAIRAGLTVDQLKDQELSYAPPYGSAKDPVNYAGFVASNVVSGAARICHVADVVAPKDNQLLLDVRTPEEAQVGTIPGARNIPLDALRGRLGELPRDKELLVFCQVGLRGYVACRLLQQKGFRCRNLTGGYKTYRAATDLPRDQPPPSSKDMTEDTGEKEIAAKKADAPAAVPLQVVREIDARGLQCPGPIMRLKEELGQVAAGQAVRIVAADPGFPADVAAWCRSTGNELASLVPRDGAFAATVIHRPRSATVTACGAERPAANKKTMVVFSGDFDKAMAAFVIANGAAAMGSEVTLFFTFWGLNVLRRPEKMAVRKNLVERMFGWMMPRGADRLTLSKMNMGGMGLRMIKGIMKRKHVTSLPDLIASARQAGVRLVACSMSMDLMGIRREELIDGVAEGGVATFLDNAEQSNVSLFI